MRKHRESYRSFVIVFLLATLSAPIDPLATSVSARVHPRAIPLNFSAKKHPGEIRSERIFPEELRDLYRASGQFDYGSSRQPVNGIFYPSRVWNFLGTNWGMHATPYLSRIRLGRERFLVDRDKNRHFSASLSLVSRSRCSFRVSNIVTEQSEHPLHESIAWGIIFSVGSNHW